MLSAEIRPRLTTLVSGWQVGRFLPTRRSLAIGACIVAVAAVGYVIARETSLFAIDRVDVTGGSKAVDAQVERALAPFVGRSLVGLNGAEVVQRIEALPSVVSATYDRSFPNTLRVRIVSERPVAVLRHGADAWLVSERGRVIQPVATDTARGLPRIWVAAKTVHEGEMLPPGLGRTVAGVLTTAGPFRARILTASLTDGVLVFHLRNRLTLVLGSPYDIALKVAVASKVLQHLPPWTRTVDVSVPSRPVTSQQ